MTVIAKSESFATSQIARLWLIGIGIIDIAKRATIVTMIMIMTITTTVIMTGAIMIAIDGFSSAHELAGNDAKKCSMFSPSI